MSKYRFGARSSRNLISVHADMQTIMLKALDLGVMDFSVIEGFRSQEEQDALYEEGRTTPGPIVTWTRNSNHTKGIAVDVVPYPVDWQDEARFHQLSGVIKAAASITGIEIDWGYDLWGKDMPHWQLK